MKNRTAFGYTALVLGATSAAVVAPMLLAGPAHADATEQTEASSGALVQGDAVVRDAVVGGSLLAAGLLGFTVINARRTD